MTQDTQTQAPPREETRIFITGSCEGLAELWTPSGATAEIELVGRSEHVRDGAGALTGGHLQAVLHATRSSALPADEIAGIREYRGRRSSSSLRSRSLRVARRRARCRRRRRPPAPAVTENVVFAIRKAGHSGRRNQGGHRRGAGRVITVFSPKGGTGKTVMATNLATSFAKYAGKKTLLLDLDLQFGDARDHARARARGRRSRTWSRHPASSIEKLAGYISRRSSGLGVLPAPIRPEDASSSPRRSWPG